MDRIPRRKRPVNMDKTSLFGLLLISQVSDNENNISVSGHKFIKEIIGDTTLKTIIDGYKFLDIKETLLAVKNSFSYEQKFFLIANMVELAFRNRVERDHEIEHIKIVVQRLEFPEENFEDIYYFCQAKISIDILN